jgi:hypothetical protein
MPANFEVLPDMLTAKDLEGLLEIESNCQANKWDDLAGHDLPLMPMRPRQANL